MLAVKAEYVAECRRVHIEPYAGFLRQLSSSVLDTDLDHVPVATIRLFAAALCHVGLRVARVRDKSNSEVAPLRPQPSARKAVTKAKVAAKEAVSSRNSAQADNVPAEKELRLMKLCLRHGLHPHRVPSFTPLVSEGEKRKDGGSDNVSHVQLSAKSAFSVIPRTPRPAATRTQPVKVVKSDAAHDITHATQRHILQSLLAGLRHVIKYSASCLTIVQLSGLPLSAIASNISTRLMQALARCPHLRVLDCSHSTLGNELFLQLTTSNSSSGLCMLREARFAECGLGDGCARGVASLLLTSGAHVGAVRWSASLRQGAMTKLRRTDKKATPQWTNSGTPREGGLSHMDLSGNALGDAILRALVHGLEGNRTVRSIDLSRNRLSANGLLDFIKSGVLQTCALQSLDVSRNIDNDITTTTEHEMQVMDALRAALTGTPFSCVHTAPQQLILTRVASTGPTRNTTSAKPQATAAAVDTANATQSAQDTPLHHDTQAEPATIATATEVTTTASAPAPSAEMTMPLLPVTQDTLSCVGNAHQTACRVLYVPALWMPSMCGSSELYREATTQPIRQATPAGHTTRCDRATSPTAPCNDATTITTINTPVMDDTKEAGSEGSNAHDGAEGHVSEAFNEQQFLAALVARLEGNENELTDRLEQHVQQTRAELAKLRAELQGWCAESTQGQRDALAALTAQHESSMRALLEEMEQRRRATPELDMRSQLAQLIEHGMDTVRAQVQAMHGITEQQFSTSNDMVRRAHVQPGRDEESTAENGQAAFLRAAHTRLAALGW